MSRPWVMVCGGGHGTVVLDVLRALDQVVLGYTDLVASGRTDCPWLGGDDALERYDPAEVFVANALGATGDTGPRARLYERLVSQGFELPPLVHPSAVVAPSVELGMGAQVMAGAVVQPGARIGRDTLVNTGASVDHDCRIGAHVHVAPGVTISGGVKVEEGAHIGVGATIIQNVRIGMKSVVGAGSLVLRDVEPGATVAGVPAREMRS